MRCLLTILFVLAMACPAASQITSAEYYIDTDPGHGAATPFSVTPGGDITQDFTVPLSSVTEGFHLVGVRAKDAQGHWSLMYFHTFYVIPGVATTVAASEYFIDSDPGYGNATAIPASSATDSSLNYVVPLSTYGQGFHTIGVRFRDALGKWSLTYQHVFYNNVNTSPVNIVRLEYYFTGNGSNQQLYTYPIVTPAPNVDLNFKANLDSLVGDREYDMHIWAVNSEGAKSEVLIKKIKVCNGEPAKARFDFVQAGNQVSFIDNSSGGSKYKWDFGDTAIDSIANPLHNYTTVGSYNVKLIVSNLCNSDTIKKIVSVVGLKDIFTNHGGNTGSVTVNVSGAGFAAGTQLFLHKTGQTDIAGDTLILKNSSLITTTFNLTNKATGRWDVFVVFSGGQKDTLKNGFTVEDGNPAKLWVNITGDNVLRIGFNQIYTITYGNMGNTDAIFVPLLINGLPLGTDIQLLSPLFTTDSSLHINEPDSVASTIQDTAKNYSLRLAYIDNIPAGSSGTLNVIFHLPLNTPLHTYPNIQIILGKPLGNSIDSLFQGKHTKSERIDFSSLGECLYNIGEAVAAVVLEGTPLEEWQKCAKGLSEIAVSNIKKFLFKERESGILKKVFDGTSKQWGYYKTAGECASAVLGTAIPEYKIVKMAREAVKFYNEVMDVGSNILKYPAFFEKGYEIGEACSDVYKRDEHVMHRTRFTPIVGNAWDPNQKYGPGNTTQEHFISGNSINYSINFENDPAANVNAQIITVVDTLNVNSYDFASFSFTSVTVGDSIYSLPNPAKSFVHDFNFTSLYGVKARVTAHFDTATGIAQWKFLTIDPITNQQTTNVLAGFLPPDVASPKGQGYVSFTVNPNPNIQDGDSIKNKASIKFDYNPVITTNSWPNVFDLIKPISQVQPVPLEVYDTTFTVQWSGTDNASGIRSYDIYYKMNNGTYQLWQSDVSLSESSFTGKKDSTYYFFSVANDNAGNIEGIKTTAERIVTVKIFDSSNKICTGISTAFSATPAGAGFTYQWQVNQGDSFINITNNSIYSGVNSIQLTLTTPPTVYSNYKYRCKISNGTVTYYSSLHAVRFVTTWLGTSGDAWETAANWSCGLVPDENTDVVIDKNAPVNPVLKITASCKSLTISQDANVIIKSGAKLIITGKL